MINWTDSATYPLDQADDYIAISHSKETAARIVASIIASVEVLERFPLAGRAGRASGTRQLVVTNTPFIVAYRVEAESILILAIYHGAQRWPVAF